MQITQSVQRPFGINVFGSSIIRVDPDIASLKFAVSRLAQHPKEAFDQAHEGAQSVRTFLSQMDAGDVGSSRVALSQQFSHSGGEARFIGYKARIAFHVLLRDLDRMEALLSGVVDTGANEISSVELQSSQLKELRAEARRRAVRAAHEKADNYCKSAGITLGPVVHIEDVSPDLMSIRHGHVASETPPDDEGAPRAFDPESVAVGAAVMIAFEIGR